MSISGPDTIQERRLLTCCTCYYYGVGEYQKLSGALRHGIQFSRKNYARGGHTTRIYVNGRGVTYVHVHNDTSASARLLSSTKRSIEFAEVKNDENELEGWRPWMFFGGTDTNLMEEREFLLDVRFTQLNVAPSYASLASPAPSLEEEGSGALPVHELFLWNAATAH